MAGWLAGLSVGELACWLNKLLGGQQAIFGSLAAWLAGWLAGWLADWLAGWVAGWRAGWLAG